MEKQQKWIRPLQRCPRVVRYKYYRLLIESIKKMDELMDMIATDESPASISDKIKDLLFTKSAEKIDEFRPAVANSMFGETEEE
jgi:fructose-bisphosphate aldolase class 1